MGVGRGDNNPSFQNTYVKKHSHAGGLLWRQKKSEGKLLPHSDHWGDLGVDGWIKLGWNSRRWDVGIWTGLGWPRIETGGGRL